MKTLLRTAVLAAGVLATSAAQAATALVTTDLNLRSGPGTRYAVVGTLPDGARVGIRGCTAGYGWCRVNYGGVSGWASSRYLATRQGSARYSNDFGNTAAAIGIPLIAGVIIGSALNDDDDDWYYRDRWHRRHWHHRHWRHRDWDGPRWRDRGGFYRHHWRRMPNSDGPHGQ